MPASSEFLLQCADLRVAVPGRTLVDGLTLGVRPGRLLAILGENGAGKSLTLQTLAGLREPAAGAVQVGGQALESWRRRELARELTLLPQYTDDAFPASVFETALAGRHPHVRPLGWESRADRQVALDCLAEVGLAGMAERDVGTLSGGERRRLAIAQALAQAPRIFLLDEPTNHLDPHHQLEVLGLFRARTARGAAVVASLHDVNLAARYADDVLLLYGDGRYEVGPVREVLTAKALSALYRTPVDAVPWRGGHVFIAAAAVPDQSR